MLEQYATGPPELRPHIRQRRLPMGRVRESEATSAKRKAEHQRERELAYSLLELDAIRQRRGDELLDHLANLVAVSLCPDWQPPLTLSTEPASRIAGRADRTIEQKDRMNGNDH